MKIDCSDNFRNLRNTRRMTQAELAEQVGVSLPTYCAYENGKKFRR